MAVNTPNDFLRFSAYQIKDLITRKLSEDKNFTDQVYEGSNLAILIDIVSYMYQCLIYNLNASAAESMFSDTQLYENISRLCTFIGYHPMGYKPATLRIQVDKNLLPSEKNQILQCTGIDTGLYDSNGKKIFFSTIFEPELEYMPITVSNNSNTNVRMLNGRWKFYGTVFTASGNGYETFILYGLQSDILSEKYVANAQIEVFVRPVEDVKNGRYDNMHRWESDSNELFVQAYNINTAPNSKFNELYDSDEEVYSLYLNEDKTYEIKFGNGIIGKKLNKGDELYIIYLDTNGPDGYIDLTQLSAVTTVKFQHSSSFFGLSEEVYKAMFNPNAGSIADDDVQIRIDFDSLTRPTPEETPDQIRESAPSWFKSGNRLITKKDYEFFVKANQSSIFDGVIDVKCMNNWDYMTSFYRWLYNFGINPVEEALLNESRTRDPFRYLSKVRLIQHGYEFVDSADANNIYLWFAMSSKNSSMEKLKSDLNSQIMLIKTMTSETYPLQAIDVNFDVSFTPSQLYYNMLVENNGDVTNDLSCSYLEITIADNTLYSNITIQNNVAKIIQTAFNEQHHKLGQSIEYSKMLDEIYQINGVERVRTVYCPDGYPSNPEYSEYKARACDGLSFASWSNTPLIDIGDDLQLNNVTRVLEPFQFPRLAGSIQNKIKVIKKSMNTTNPVKF